VEVKEKEKGNNPKVTGGLYSAVITEGRGDRTGNPAPINPSSVARATKSVRQKGKSKVRFIPSFRSPCFAVVPRGGEGNASPSASPRFSDGGHEN